MDEIVQSHVIDPAALRADNFESFFRARSQALLDRIERAMGKPIARDMIEAEPAEVAEYDTEEIEA